MAVEVVLPVLGITVEKGSILKWLKAEGEAVEKGEPLFEVETDKVTMEVESPASGILRRILVPEGVEVPILTVVAVITEPGEELPEKYQRVAIEAQGISSSKKRSQGREIKIMPAARRLARQEGVDLASIKGTGPGGTILKRDVLEFLNKAERIEQPPELAADADRAQPRASTIASRLAAKEGISLSSIKGTGIRGRIMKADVMKALQEERKRTFGTAVTLGQVIHMSKMRKAIARRMTQSAFTAPHIYFFTDVNMGKLLELRRDILQEFQARFGLRPSINDFLIKAVAMTIEEYPLLNAYLVEDEIHIAPQINVGLAVALEEGLIVPAVPRANELGLGDIARFRADLVERARAGTLDLEELERGTFTISSLAQFDITYFTAILNPPQSGILSVGRTRDVLVKVEGEITEQSVATYGLSVDHRIIDGTTAAAFLQSLKRRLENPHCAFLQL